jgi:hypothetical protein
LQHAQNQIENAALVSLHEEGEGILVALSTGFHELSVILLAGLRDNAWESPLRAVCHVHEILVPTDAFLLASGRDLSFVNWCWLFCAISVLLDPIYWHTNRAALIKALKEC